jgi:periplasmic divalent cation tolerance protein
VLWENKGDVLPIASTAQQNLLPEETYLSNTFAVRVRFVDNVYIIVLVTTASKHEAEEIVQHLLGDKLIACANIVGPVSSFFRWSGKIDRAEEYLVLMKSRRDLFDRLTEAVKIMHSYEVPEILAIPVVEGSKAYLDWLESCLP